MEVKFNCGSCGASLKVKAALVGRILQCPRCGKRTKVVPEGESAAPETAVAPEATGAPAPASATPSAAESPSPVLRPSVPPPAPAPAPEPPTPGVPLPEAVKQEAGVDPARVAELTQALKEAELRAQRAEAICERAAQEMQDAKTTIVGESEARHRQEIEAARRTIGDLQSALSAERQKRVAAGAGALPRADKAAELTEDELASADALIAGLKASPIGREMRMSLLIHAAVMLLTSIGYIVGMVKGKSAADEAQPKAPPAAEAPAESSGRGGSDGPESNTSAATPASPEPTKSAAVDRAVESLPSRDELPKDTGVSLELDR